MNRRRYILCLLLACVAGIRCIPGGGEWYATSVYPYISCVLSLLTSVIPFSAEEIIVIAATLTLVACPLWHNRSMKTAVARLAETAAWIYVWFYMGWACNYYRDNFYTRMQVTPAKVDKTEFGSFLSSYTDSLNHYAELAQKREELSEQEKAKAEEEIKTLMASAPSEAALCQPRTFQHPKKVLLNFIYNAVGVLGYMGPFGAESQLNNDLLPVQYAFVYAHELSHLLGVSSEAEANYWAYRTCLLSADVNTRYAAYYNILPNVSRNAASILSDAEYESWKTSLSSRVTEQAMRHSAYWAERRSPFWDEIQTAIFNTFLKSNRIHTGIKNYDQVVSMILSTSRNERE